MHRKDHQRLAVIVRDSYARVATDMDLTQSVRHERLLGVRRLAHDIADDLFGTNLTSPARIAWIRRAGLDRV